MPKIGVILSGCGVYDGSEIHEAVLTLYFLDLKGAEAVCMAPDVPQMHVVNHLTGKPADGESRNVLVESARIARGDIKNLADVKASGLDGIIFPGGFGAAKNLCDFAVKGEECEAHPDVIRLTREMYEAKKPVGAVCIAPALMAKVFQGTGVKPKMTIGTDEGTAAKINAMDSVHVDCAVEKSSVDRENKVVSTPAYMLGRSIKDVAPGIKELVDEVLALV